MDYWIRLTIALIAIGVAAWVALRWLRQQRYPGDERLRMRLVQTLYLGTRERLVVVSFNERYHVFGVSGGKVSHIGPFEDLAGEESTGPPARPMK